MPTPSILVLPRGLTIADSPGKQKLSYRRVYAHHYRRVYSHHCTPNSIQSLFKQNATDHMYFVWITAHMYWKRCAPEDLPTCNNSYRIPLKNYEIYPENTHSHARVMQRYSVLFMSRFGTKYETVYFMVIF